MIAPVAPGYVTARRHVDAAYHHCSLAFARCSLVGSGDTTLARVVAAARLTENPLLPVRLARQNKVCDFRVPRPTPTAMLERRSSRLSPRRRGDLLKGKKHNECPGVLNFLVSSRTGQRKSPPNRATRRAAALHVFRLARARWSATSQRSAEYHYPGLTATLGNLRSKVTKRAL
jgi:hypothetical protein